MSAAKSAIPPCQRPPSTSCVYSFKNAGRSAFGWLQADKAVAPSGVSSRLYPTLPEQELSGGNQKQQKNPWSSGAFLHGNTQAGSRDCFTSAPAGMVWLIRKRVLFPIRRTLVVLVYVAVPFFIGHRRPMIRVESRRCLQSLLGNIENVVVFRHVVLERAERDCEQLFSHAEKAAKRYDGIRDPAGTGVDDDFLDVSEAIAFGVDHVRADDARRFYGRTCKHLLCTHRSSPVA